MTNTEQKKISVEMAKIALKKLEFHDKWDEKRQAYIDFMIYKRHNQPTTMPKVALHLGWSGYRYGNKFVDQICKEVAEMLGLSEYQGPLDSSTPWMQYLHKYKTKEDGHLSFRLRNEIVIALAELNFIRTR